MPPVLPPPCAGPALLTPAGAEGDGAPEAVPPLRRCSISWMRRLRAKLALLALALAEVDSAWLGPVNRATQPEVPPLPAT